MNEESTISWPDDHAPPELPGFELIREIGRGRFGRVWLARNQTTHGPVAVKVIPLRSPDSADLAGREISALGHLEEFRRYHHPGLLPIHHVGIHPVEESADDRCLYYTMDLADDLTGGSGPSDPGYQPATLKKRLDAGLLDPEKCLRDVRQLLGGLAFLHEKGLVHRDVKPANCLFVAEELKLADFGLLTRADRQLSRVGTPQYMPPDGQMDARADVYAAGLVIYEMITGLSADSFPHLGNSANRIANNLTLAALNRLVLRARHPNRSERFEDARQMLDSLESSLQAEQARRRRAGLVFAAVFVIGLVLLGLWLAPPNRVHVNFITEPYGARILLDGEVLEDPATGIEYTTPCSVPNLTARVHHVVFQSDEWDEFDAGPIDFATTREVFARIGVAVKPRAHSGAIGTSESER